MLEKQHMRTSFGSIPSAILPTLCHWRRRNAPMAFSACPGGRLKGHRKKWREHRDFRWRAAQRPWTKRSLLPLRAGSPAPVSGPSGHAFPVNGPREPHSGFQYHRAIPKVGPPSSDQPWAIRGNGVAVLGKSALGKPLLPGSADQIASLRDAPPSSLLPPCPDRVGTVMSVAGHSNSSASCKNRQL